MRSYLNPIKDIIATYESQDRIPSRNELDRLAIERKLPYSHSIYQLSFYEELTPNQRLKHCVDTYDFESFERLYKGGRLEYLEEWDRGSRNKIARLYLSLNDKPKGHKRIFMALRNELYDLVAELIDDKTTIYASDLTKEQLLGLAKVWDDQEMILASALQIGAYEAARYALDHGATGTQVYDSANDVPEDIILRLTNLELGVPEPILARLVSISDEEELVKFVERYEDKIDWSLEPSIELLKARLRGRDITLDHAVKLLKSSHVNRSKISRIISDYLDEPSPERSPSPRPSERNGLVRSTESRSSQERSISPMKNSDDSLGSFSFETEPSEEEEEWLSERSSSLNYDESEDFSSEEEDDFSESF